METKTYSITLADGTVLDNLRMNGNTFISNESINPSVFNGNCSTMTISDGETDETWEKMQYVHTAQPIDGEFWFSFAPISEQEQTRADVVWLLLMQG